MAAKNYMVNSYTNDTWTDLVSDASIIASVIIANTDPANTITFEMRIDNGAGTELARLIPPSTIDLNVSQTLDLRAVVIETGQRLQVKALAAGLHFTANGETL